MSSHNGSGTLFHLGSHRPPWILAHLRRRCFPAPKPCKLLLAALATTPGWSQSIGLKRSQKFRARLEVASELRYREPVVVDGTLIVSISQSGETADTLAAINHLGGQGLARLAVCNVDHSAIVRVSELVFLTQAGAEIGVASTKAFTTQLAALMALTDQLAGITNKNDYQGIFASAMASAPAAVTAVLALEPRIKAMANHFVAKHHALFLGRGVFYPIAMEGGAQTQGNLIHSCRSLSCWRVKAWPSGARGF